MKTLIKILYTVSSSGSMKTLMCYHNVRLWHNQTFVGLWHLKLLIKITVECKILLLEERNTKSLDLQPEVFDVFKALAQNTEMSKQEDGISASTPITGRWSLSTPRLSPSHHILVIASQVRREEQQERKETTVNSKEKKGGGWDIGAIMR